MHRLLPLVLFFAFWVPAAHAWTWPVRGPVVQMFSFDPSHPYAGGQHRGVDLGATEGAPVLAPAGGSVTFAGSVPTSGLTVTIETADGLSVTLTHLGSLAVERRATVAEGATIGTVGATGSPEVDGPYVHLGIRSAADPNGYLDPLSLLPATPASEPPPESSQDPAATAPPPEQGAGDPGPTPAAGVDNPAPTLDAASAPDAVSSGDSSPSEAVPGSAMAPSSAAAPQTVVAVADPSGEVSAPVVDDAVAAGPVSPPADEARPATPSVRTTPAYETTPGLRSGHPRSPRKMPIPCRVEPPADRLAARPGQHRLL